MSSTEVASHYNSVRQTGIEERKQSRIFYLRNMNNWMKSMLINEALDELKRGGGDVPRGRGVRVLDLACGKGGDLRKWGIAGAASVVMADVAEVSIEQAKGRYEEMKRRDRNLFPAQFIVADCCKEDLSSKVDVAFQPFDLVSCQFALHYSFIDESSARCFIRNATALLRPGGIFIGTLPDAERIVWAARSASAGDGRWANLVCSVSYDKESSSLAAPPLFGATFHFTLDEQVNCPEFLAYFPLLTRLLEEEGMELMFSRRFPEAAETWLKKENSLDGLRLAERMQGLEDIPRRQTAEDEPAEDDEYAHVADVKRREENVGTLSRSEYEAFSMYLVFAFRKKAASAASTEGVEKEKTVT